jgi:hypothetical protein
MEAVDWTALSVLAAVVLGAIGYLARDMHRQLHALEVRIDARFTQVDGRFDRVEQRIDALTERYVRHLEAHASH